MKASIRQVAVVAGLLLLAACGESGISQGLSATPSATPTTFPLLSPSQSAPGTESPSLPASPIVAYSPIPSPVGTPVARQVLAPAIVLPVTGLCTTPIIETADGNAEPRFCREGSINVLAWRFYVSISPNILGVGRDATVDQIHTAFMADGKYHPTNPEEQASYYLAAAYYGWHFSGDPSCWLWSTTTC